MNTSRRHLPARAWRYFLACCFLAAGTVAAHAQAGTTISIMALGDSLTWGYDGGPDTPQYLAGMDTGGYRSPLYLALGAQGVNVNYVGASNGNPSPVLTAAGQTAQNGYNGYRIDDIANNLAASVPGSDGVSNSGGYWLTRTAAPNIILLQAGANDIEQGYDPLFTGTPGTETAAQMGQDTATRMVSLINQILGYDPNTWIFTDGTSNLVNTPFADSAAYYYAIDLQSMIAQDYGASSSQHVVYVDMHDAIIKAGYFSLLQGDGIHLNVAGYGVMGNVWADSILADYNFADAESAPEPSTWALIGVGLAGLFAWRRMRKA